jgi:hypothetical protein
MTKTNNIILRLAYGETEEAAGMCDGSDESNDDDGKFDENDIVQALSNAGFNEKDDESGNTGQSEQPEPTINGL